MSRFIISLLALLLLLGATSVLSPLAAAEGEDRTAVEETAVPAAQDDTGTTEDEGGLGDLPEGLSRIFASLGLYIVTMFTMAIGTEIVVDVFKLGVGLKGKPMAKKTLDEYERLLPGALEDLGVAAEARRDLQAQLLHMRRALAPALKAQEVVAHLRAEEFNQALEELVSAEEQAEWWAEAEQVLAQQVKTAVARLDPDSPLGRAAAAKLEGEVKTLVASLVDEAGDVTPNELARKTAVVINGRLAEAVTEWTEEQLIQLQEVSAGAAQRIYREQIAPQIKSAGFSPATEQRIQRQFENFLENLEQSQTADHMLQAVNNLLVEVETQRDELAAIWRKLLGKVARRLKARLPWFPWEAKKVDPTIPDATAAGAKLLELERRHKAENESRIQQLRFVSVIVGVLLAYFLQIDSADLLGALFPADANFLYMVLVPADSGLVAWIKPAFGMESHPLTAGIILTGLAASAGSGFWHDQLSRLQTVQQSVESAYRSVQPVVAQIQTDADEKK